MCVASFPGPLLERLLCATFDPRGSGVQRSRINIARGGEPGDKANLCVLCGSFVFCVPTCRALNGAIAVFIASALSDHPITSKHLINNHEVRPPRLSPDQSLLACFRRPWEWYAPPISSCQVVYSLKIQLQHTYLHSPSTPPITKLMDNINKLL